MASFKLTEAAKLDLRRIYLRGLEEFGEAQADKYYNALFDRFQALAEQPLAYPAVEGLCPGGMLGNVTRPTLAYPAVEGLCPGYRRSVCGVDSIYYRNADFLANESTRTLKTNTTG